MEESTGKQANGFLVWGVIGVLTVIATVWFVQSGSSDDPGVAAATPITVEQEEGPTTVIYKESLDGIRESATTIGEDLRALVTGYNNAAAEVDTARRKIAEELSDPWFGDELSQRFNGVARRVQGVRRHVDVLEQWRDENLLPAMRDLQDAEAEHGDLHCSVEAAKRLRGLTVIRSELSEALVELDGATTALEVEVDKISAIDIEVLREERIEEQRLAYWSSQEKAWREYLEEFETFRVQHSVATWHGDGRFWPIRLPRNEKKGRVLRDGDVPLEWLDLCCASGRDGFTNYRDVCAAGKAADDWWNLSYRRVRENDGRGLEYHYSRYVSYQDSLRQRPVAPLQATLQLAHQMGHFLGGYEAGDLPPTIWNMPPDVRDVFLKYFGTRLRLNERQQEARRRRLGQALTNLAFFHPQSGEIAGRWHYGAISLPYWNDLVAQFPELADRMELRRLAWEESYREAVGGAIVEALGLVGDGPLDLEAIRNGTAAGTNKKDEAEALRAQAQESETIAQFSALLTTGQYQAASTSEKRVEYGDGQAHRYSLRELRDCGALEDSKVGRAKFAVLVEEVAWRRSGIPQDADGSHTPVKLNNVAEQQALFLKLAPFWVSQGLLDP